MILQALLFLGLFGITQKIHNITHMAPVMKWMIYLSAILVFEPSNAQQLSESERSIKTIDSLQYIIKTTRNFNQRHGYDTRLISLLSRIDTTYASVDSLVITFTSAAQFPLFQMITKYRSPDCKAYEKLKYFNNKGQKDYEEFWSCYCKTGKEDPDDYIFDKKLRSYERWSYDSTGRVKLHVVWASEIGGRKYFYSYDAAEKKTVQISKIDQSNFWD